VTLLLKATYGSPRLNNKDDLLDELLFILLSQMTTGPSYERVFGRPKSAIPDSTELLTLETAVLVSVIANAVTPTRKRPG
jgi:hypothetical protein